MLKNFSPKLSKSLSFAVFVLLFNGLLMHPVPVYAFDTGHHSDLTRNALAREGFDESAIKVVILQNWLTDFYGAHPLASDRLAPRIKLIRDQAEKLHFDNLFSTDDIRNYWVTLANNTRRGVMAEAGAGNDLGVLTLLGVSLHAVQDFYSHSNWIETQQAAGDTFRPKTWIDVENAGGVPLPLVLHTGCYPDEMCKSFLVPPGSQPHNDIIINGKLVDGLNKDSYRRRGWDQAYVFAYAATRQWIQAVHSWVVEATLDKPNFWRDRIQKFSSCSQADTDDLERDLLAAYRLSEWAISPSNLPKGEGHWKGANSADVSLLIGHFESWGAHESRFVREFTNKMLSGTLTIGLYGRPTPARLPPISPAPINEMAVIVRTTTLLAILPPNPFGRKFITNMFSKIIISPPAGSVPPQQEFIESTQQGDPGLRDVWPWQTIMFVSTGTSSVNVTYRLLNERSSPSLEDQVLDINSNPSEEKLDFNFKLADKTCTGDITGVHDVNEAMSQGDGSKVNSAQIGLIINARGVVSQ